MRLTSRTLPASPLFVSAVSPRPPPDVAALGEGGGADDLGGHPGVGARRTHLGGAVPLACQAEVGDLQRLVGQVLVLYPLQDQDWIRDGV